MSDTNTYPEDVMVPIGDVARRFGVTVATVRAWEKAGKITAVRTPGNHRVFRRSDVDALLNPAPERAA